MPDVHQLQLLPQVSNNGYYSYSPAARQYGTSATIQAIVDVCRTFRLNMPDVVIGVGDISFKAGGPMPPHASHKDGRQVDIRPLRADRKRLPVDISDAQYSRELTRLLVEALQAHDNVTGILFNDTAIKGVTKWAGHNNHLHVKMKA